MTSPTRPAIHGVDGDRDHEPAGSHDGLRWRGPRRHVEGECLRRVLAHRRRRGSSRSAGAIEVIHGVDGLGFKENYFGPINPVVSYYQVNAGRAARGLGQGRHGAVPGARGTWRRCWAGRAAAPTSALGVFGMYNHIDSPSNKQDRLKFGADLNVMPTSFMAVGVRFDRVMPNAGDTTRGLLRDLAAADLPHQLAEPRVRDRQLHAATSTGPAYVRQRYGDASYTSLHSADHGTQHGAGARVRGAGSEPGRCLGRHFVLSLRAGRGPGRRC